jgi:hypothetical protein
MLDAESPSYALDVLSIVEAILENPMVILRSQQDKEKDRLMAEWKASGVEYEERMERLDEVTWPKPLEDDLYAAFNLWRTSHPWVEGDTVQPKAVARDLFERAMGFHDFVRHYGLKRSEGVVLRYLSDAYKALMQTVPEWAASEELDDLREWLGETVRGVDASLIQEWERLKNPDDVDEVLAAGDGAADAAEPVVDVTRNARAFGVMVRNEVFRWVQLLALRNHAELVEVPGTGGSPWTVARLDEAMAPYWAEHGEIGTGAEARGAGFYDVDGDTVTQTLADPEGHREWVLRGTVDREASAADGRAVVHLDAIVRL